MTRRLLAPSLMCADFEHLAHEVSGLEAAGADLLHLDVMDGNFVPNFALGRHDVEAIRRLTTLPLECHLMVANPDLAIEVFAAAGADILDVHVESTPHIARTLTRIRQLGLQPGVALNPGTPVTALEPIVDLAERVLVMTVNPGFAGQSYLDWVDRKIVQVLELTAGRGITVSVDGAISPDRIARLSKLGVAGFILGTSALFTGHHSAADYLTTLERLRSS